MEPKKPDFYLEELRSWTKEEIIEWYADGQYAHFIYDPPADQPDPEKRRRCVLIHPKNRAQREMERDLLVPAMEFHAGWKVKGAYQRLVGRGVKNPSRATIEAEVLLSADARNQALIDALHNALHNALNKWFDCHPEVGT